MTGSEADTDRDIEGDESTDSSELARFLTPVPRPRSSKPPAPSAPVEGAPAKPVSAKAPSQSGLFSELPVPRRNSSLLPPPADADITPTPADEPRAPKYASRPKIAAAFERDAPSLSTSEPTDDAFSEHETSTGNLALETPLRDESLESEPDQDDEFAAPPRPLGTLSRRRVIAAAVALVVVAAGIAFMLKRPPRPTALPPKAAVETATTGEPSNEPGVPAAQDESEPAVDRALAQSLRREARQLLEAGQAERGVALARRAIQADPNHPEAYILLAAGLQDLGQWEESRQVFAKCVHQSNGKPNDECVYFATRSK